MYPQKQQILKNRHTHMFLEKSAAFTFTDVHICGHMIKADILIIIFLNEFYDIPESLQMLLRLAAVLRKVRKVMVELSEYLQKYHMYLKFVIWRFVIGHMIDVPHLAKDILVP